MLSLAMHSQNNSTTVLVPGLRSENDRRTEFPRFQGDALDANLALVQHVKELAAKKGVIPGQLALAWVHAQVRARCAGQACMHCALAGVPFFRCGVPAISRSRLVWTQGPDVHPIPGTKQMKYLEVRLHATQLLVRCANACCHIAHTCEGHACRLPGRKDSHGCCHCAQENAAAFFIELSAEDKAYLENVFAPDKVINFPWYICLRWT